MVTQAGLYRVTCALVFVGILVACLWPFHSPRNDVAWLAQGSGLRFGDHGTMVSLGPIDLSDEPAGNDWTLEIWLRPTNGYDSETILALYDSQRPQGLLVRQANGDLVAEGSTWSELDRSKTPQFRAAGAFGGHDSLFVTLTSGSRGTSAYIDGVPVAVDPRFHIPSGDLSGQLVVANSPVDNDSWSGELRGLAIYHRELAAAQIYRHYAAWTQTGRPGLTPDEGAVAIYLFDEHAGNVAHNRLASGTDLSIPDRYLEVRQAFLKRPWKEYYPGWNYWKNVVINIGGFIPLGFCLYAYLSFARRVRHAVLATVVVGGLLSLAIETLQAFLPTRDSGLTDVLTNTMGTAAGVGLFSCMARVCEGLSTSPHIGVRRLASLFTRRDHGQESELNPSERASKWPLKRASPIESKLIR
jgi:VanZ family protein